MASESADEVKAQALMEILGHSVHCPICMNVFQHPISTPCGHTFCRDCLKRSMVFKALCPTCRATAPLMVYQSCENAIIREMCHHYKLMTAPPSVAPSPSSSTTSLISSNTDEDAPTNVTTPLSAEPTHEFNTWPLFAIPFLPFPGQPGQLNVFESRYLLLLDRALFADRMFVMHGRGLRGDLGTLVQIEGEVYERHGRVGSRVLQVKIVGHKRVEFVEDAAELGHEEDQLLRLKSCKVRLVEDVEGPQMTEQELPEESRRQIAILRELSSLLYRHLSPGQLDYVKLTYGECPAESHRSSQQWQQFTFWLAACIRCSAAQKHEMFASRSAVSRIDCVASIVKGSSELQGIYECLRKKHSGEVESDEFVLSLSSPDMLTDCAYRFFAVDRDFSTLPYSANRMCVVYAAVVFVLACIVRGLLAR